MEIKTSEFFKNLKYLPAPGTDDFFQLIEWEKQKCLGGVTIQGVFIPGWLYWHLNHWWIGIDEEDEYGNETIVPKLPELRDNEWERAEAIEACKNSKKGYIEIGQRRGGKALLNSSPLYTPQGEIPIGQAKVGMKIYDPQGELTTIKEVYPQGLRPIYRVHLQDGRDIFADENHLWKVYNKDTQNWKVLSTKYLLDKGLRRPRIHTGYKDGMIHLTEESKFALPNSKCVPYEEKDVRIDPYWLGLWLADGNSRSTAITNIDKEVIDYIYQYADKLGMRVSIDHQKDRSADSFFIISGVGKRNYLLTALREYNLLENKHIPHLYLHSSEKQRRKLLAGLLDGDGTATKNGSISFSNSNKKLIDDVVFLVRSLGMRCRVSSKIPTFTYKGEKKKGKVAYKVKIYSREKLFGLTRKNDRVAKNKRLSNDDKTFINSIDFAGWGEATCIVVDNEDKLFLTEGFTPTHNSEALTSFLAYNSILFENSQNAIITGNSNDQAVIIQKFDFGHKKLWDGLYIPKLDKDWRRSSVRLGYKDVSNEDHVHSLIAVRNANNGNNTEVAAGLTLKTFILDEALHEDTPIHYQGYTKPLKDVQVGDMIYGPDGDLSEVGDKINPGVVETLKISLSDGREIVASPNHLWKVYNTTLGKYEVITTEDINNKYFYTKYDSRYDKYYKSYIYSLPNIEPLNFPNERITIDPYWLGCWLADGTKKSTMITTPDEEIVEYCQNYADNLDLDCTVTHLNNARRVSIVNHSRKGNSLLSSLREYNLIDNKHIPIEYLYNSTTVRMQLLRGLMDSDGSCDKNGKIEFTTSSFKLAEDIKFLIRGLGINVHITQRQGKYKNKGGEYIKTKTSYRFSIFTDKRIFDLPRKASNMSLFPNKKQKAYRERTTIVGISPNGPAQVYCLKMKNSSGMFLAGDLIPTHNCGKWNFGEVLAAAKPALLSPKGWRGIVLLTGCVCAGTKVWTKKGELKNIEDLQVEDGILGYDGKSYYKEDIKHMKLPSKKPCLRITTTSGNYIECSTDHPFLSSTKKKCHRKGITNVSLSEFVKASNLRVGDRLYKITGENFFGNVKDKNAYLLGLLIGDGYYVRGCEVSIDDEAVYKYIRTNYDTAIHKEFTTKSGGYYRGVRINGFNNHLREYGMWGQVKLEKRIPRVVHNYDRESLVNFIAGYFDADGNVKISGERSLHRIVLTSTVYPLLEEMKYLLSKLGIQSSIVKENRNTPPSEEYKGQIPFIYRLYIAKGPDILKFKECIPLKHSLKKKSLEKIEKRQRSYGRSPNYFYPSQDEDLSTSIEEGLIENTVFENISKIEDIGEQYVYNLQTIDTHTYIANGFITHNTGGSFTHGEDCERYFNNPESNKFMGFKDEETGKITGKFMSGLYRMDCKVDSTLADYLQDKRGVELDPKQYKKLSKIPMKVSDKELARRKIEEDRALKAKDPNRVEYLKEVMYYPLTPDECFMTEGVNIFNEIAIKQQQEFLYASGKYLGDKCILSEELNGEIHCEIVRDDSIAPISTFPLNDNESKEGCIIIYEHPPKNPPYGLYVSAIDPLKHDKSSGDSLQSIYVFKRMNDVSSEEYQDMIVAQYTGRMETLEQTCEICRLLIKYYNALTFVENEDIYFIKYMQAKMEDHYLVDEQPFIKNLHPSSNVERGKGFHATPKIVAYLNSCLKSYSEEVIAKDRNEEGEVIKKILGVSKILDPMLLEEMRKFRVDSGNYDRIRAASAAIALARHMDPFYKVSSPSGETTNKSKKKKRRRRDLLSRKLSGGSSLVRNTKPSLRN